jgi:transcriptional regulator with XRE-family HTH domain
MANNQYDKSTLHARISRAHAGEYLSALRKDKGLTQRDVSEELELKYYTFISQVENGQGRLPPKLWVKTAKCLGVNIQEFSLKMLEFYDPHAFFAITKGEETTEDVNTP